MSDPPKKYIKINGIMKLNPVWKKWKEDQAKASGGAAAPVAATSVANPSQALPVVTNMEDHEAISAASAAAGGPEIALSESTNATIEMMQEPEIAGEAGMTPDTMVDELGAVLNKYEVPMGLMNKLMMLSEYDVLEFMIDDSGSMTLASDTVDPLTGKTSTRWAECHRRLKEMIEIIAYVPFQQIGILFLNRQTTLGLTRNGRDPKTFLADAFNQIDNVFKTGPSGSTPAFEKIQTSLAMGQGKQIARYFFGDGIPNGGQKAQKKIVEVLNARANPQGNPMTFLSCTNEDAAVEWMKDAEEIVPYCSESDDFKDESAEVMKDQGAAFPFSYGFYLICALVGASNPDDLDCMDESVPFTRPALGNLLGIEQDEQSYKHYFDRFLEAQSKRPIEGPSDQLKKSVDWKPLYQDFMQAPTASMIPFVQDFKKKIAAAH
ncbi:expressed unknown protein [Seminavis robusta]|uniref:VWFA domain-containing protein n=1 Tax=Seminavis robusta TaxID=568900 RepID=A0A9N8DS58_9STRA|nr:expressed unknown protein [Seminavis robusta]|eukprot:Sro331_g119160.1 n/a (434) ;mRNA; r:43248-44906